MSETLKRKIAHQCSGGDPYDSQVSKSKIMGTGEKRRHGTATTGYTYNLKEVMKNDKMTETCNMIRTHQWDTT